MREEVEMTKVRWGILSTADIGMAQVTPAIQMAGNCEVVAIASRDADRARAAADELAIPSSYGSYEALLAAEDVDAVYIPLPNDMHAEWTYHAAEAGKHILCEKPLAMTADQAQSMVDACADIVSSRRSGSAPLPIMEVRRLHSHPNSASLYATSCGASPEAIAVFSAASAPHATESPGRPGRAQSPSWPCAPTAMWA